MPQELICEVRNATKANAKVAYMYKKNDKETIKLRKNSRRVTFWTIWYKLKQSKNHENNIIS